MKREHVIPIFLALFVMLVSQPTAQAQFGLRGGVNFANYNDTDTNFDSRTGLAIGAYYNISVPMSPLSIQPEVLYSQKGAEQSGVTVKVDYIEIPVLAKFSFAPGPISPHIYAGPYAGFVLNSEVENGGVSINVDNAQTDFGGIVGAGIGINAGVTKLDLGVRYGFGFADAFDGGQGKNGVLSIVGGIAL